MPPTSSVARMTAGYGSEAGKHAVENTLNYSGSRCPPLSRPHNQELTQENTGLSKGPRGLRRALGEWARPQYGDRAWAPYGLVQSTCSARTGSRSASHLAVERKQGCAPTCAHRGTLGAKYPSSERAQPLAGGTFSGMAAPLHFPAWPLHTQTVSAA